MPLIFTRITLIAPGCFSSLANAYEPESHSEQVNTAPELNDSKVIETPSHAYEQALAGALHQSIPELGALPVAQHRFLFDTGRKAPPHCVCAELIHLQADKDNARLLPVQALNVTEDESEQLFSALNDLIRDDGLAVFRTSANNFYLTGMPASELDTWPAHAVANGKIADYLPRKSEAGDWRRLMTEAQMLFHTHPVNVARANAQQLPINAMWFWGGAKAATPVQMETVDLFTTDAYACGLATAMNIVPKRLTEIDWSNLANEVVVVDLNVYEAWLSGDLDAMQNAKQALHDQWITPAQNAVANGLCSEFVLDGCEGQAIVEIPKQVSATALLWKRFSIRKWFERERKPASDATDRANKSDSNP